MEDLEKSESMKQSEVLHYTGLDNETFNFIRNIPLELSVELGKANMVVNDLLKLCVGSIIELDKYAGEPADIYINQKLVASGEVTIVNGKVCIRMTDVITDYERTKRHSLKDTNIAQSVIINE